jgi:hypothetical protein
MVEYGFAEKPNTQDDGTDYGLLEQPSTPADGRVWVCIGLEPAH